MKLKKGFVLKEVAGKCVAVPTGTDINFNGMITLNGTAKVLWDCLKKGAETEDLTNALLAEYDVDRETAEKHAAAFVEKLKGLNFLE